MSKAIFKRALIHDEAFITSVVRYGEADCIVRLLVRKEGKVVAFFKRGLAAKKNHGSIQALSMARIGYCQSTETQMMRLFSCDMDPQSFLWATSLKHFAYGNYLAELVEKLLPEEEAAPIIFELLQTTIGACKEAGAQPYILRAFELQLLEYLGYLPEIPADIDEKDIFYDPIACCFAYQEHAQSFAISHQALVLARSMILAPIGEISSHDEVVLRQIGRIFYSRLHLMGILPLKSTEFFKELSWGQK